MIIGFHLIWTTYGHWFPNDPRGSWSEEVWKPQLLKVRTPDRDHRLDLRQEVSVDELEKFMSNARQRLKWEAVQLTDSEIRKVAETFAEMALAIKLDVHACAILSNHVHLVTERNNQSY